MKKVLSIISCLLCIAAVNAQKIDSIYFNLYTDSLKKGPLHFNYINVDGKLSDGSYIPLDTTQIRFTVSAGKITGNVLTLDSSLKDAFVTVTAFLIADPNIRKQVNIYIKKRINEEMLKSQEELIEGWQKKNKRN